MADLKDVARKAGVSVSTASKALNNYPGVSPRTKEKVLKVAKLMNYSPNPNARQMVTGKSHILGILTSDTSEYGIMHPFNGIQIEYFRRYVNQHGYDVIIMPSNTEDMNMTYVEYSNYRMLDGIYVLRYSGLDDNLIDLLESNIPIITSDVDYPNIPIVESNNVDAAYRAYEYLYKLGHRDIFHLAGPQNSLSARERLQGFHEGQHMFSSNDNLNYYSVEVANEFDYISGYEGTRRLLKKRGSQIPDAIICSADIMAIGSINALYEMGFSVPDDCSVIGFDNIEFAKYSRPSLTTMAQDPKKLASLIGELLIQKISGKKISKTTYVPMSLVQRDSVANRNIK